MCGLDFYAMYRYEKQQSDCAMHGWHEQFSYQQDCMIKRTDVVCWCSLLILTNRLSHAVYLTIMYVSACAVPPATFKTNLLKKKH